MPQVCIWKPSLTPHLSLYICCMNLLHQKRVRHFWNLWFSNSSTTSLDRRIKPTSRKFFGPILVGVCICRVYIIIYICVCVYIVGGFSTLRLDRKRKRETRVRSQRRPSHCYTNTSSYNCLFSLLILIIVIICFSVPLFPSCRRPAFYTHAVHDLHVCHPCHPCHSSKVGGCGRLYSR